MTFRNNHDISSSDSVRKGSEHKKERERGNHNISISNLAWEGLERKRKKWNLRSRSELIEKIGKSEDISLEKKSQSNDSLVGFSFGYRSIPIAVRLESLYTTKNPLLRSITASIYRYGKQLKLDEDVSESDVKANEYIYDMVNKVLIDTVKIIEIINYIKPEYAPHSMSGLINWIAYNIILSKKRNLDAFVWESNLKEEENIEIIEEETKKMRRKIGYAFFRFKSTHAKEFSILHSRFVLKKDYAIIVDYLNRVNGETYTAESIMQESVAARSVFRAYIHQLEKDGDLDDSKLDELSLEYEKLMKKVFPLSTLAKENLKLYCELAYRKYLTEDQSNKIIGVLELASTDLSLDFWINEFDHLNGHRIREIPKGKKYQGDKISRIIPSYYKEEKKYLDALEYEAKKSIMKLREEINTGYSLIEDISGLDRFLYEKLKDMSSPNIWPMLQKTYKKEAADMAYMTDIVEKAADRDAESHD